MNSRLLACRILLQVLRQKRSLTHALEQLPFDQNSSFIKAICFGVLRHYFRLSFIVNDFLKKNLKAKDTDIFILMLIGLYQLIFMRVSAHAAVFETVNAAKSLKKPWATALINKVLRNYLKNQQEIDLKINGMPSAYYDHPDWLIKLIQDNWPMKWHAILNANNQQAPMSLRINLPKISREAYRKKLSLIPIDATLVESSSACIQLKTPCAVTELPDFLNGYCSVQDQAAQFAAPLLELKPHQYVLDACAAPGGKTAHILESENNLDVIALDIDESRCQKIANNLQRLNLTAKIICTDAQDITAWWNKKLFDRILLDAPCSATGVIRRHPDIKILREATDIANLAAQQFNLLFKLWPLLKSQGLLLYSTCSILAEENQKIIEKFLAAQQDAREKKISLPAGQSQNFGWQILPGELGMDGFYYCLLKKI